MITQTKLFKTNMQNHNFHIHHFQKCSTWLCNFFNQEKMHQSFIH